MSRDNSPDKLDIDQQLSQKTLRKSKALGGLVGAAIGGLGFALGDGNGGLNAIIEFFDPIKPKGALLSKTKSTGKIKDKGSTQKHNYGKKVPADDSTQEEHGCITFYGFVDKQRFKYNAFHSRWIVLRGFNLYWYRSSNDK